MVEFAIIYLIVGFILTLIPLAMDGSFEKALRILPIKNPVLNGICFLALGTVVAPALILADVAVYLYRTIKGR